MIVHITAILALAVACGLWVVIQRVSGRDAGRPCSGAGTCKRPPGEECPRKRGEPGGCAAD